MEAAWIGLVGVLIGAAVTGTISIILLKLQLHHQRAETDRLRRLENLERLYRTLAGFLIVNLKDYHMDVVDMMSVSMDLRERQLRVNKLNTLLLTTATEISLLVAVNAPELSGAWLDFNNYVTEYVTRIANSILAKDQDWLAAGGVYTGATKIGSDLLGQVRLYIVDRAAK